MSVSAAGARLVGGRFRRASWVFGLVALILFSYFGAYLVAALAALGIWGVFRMAALWVERAGGLGKRDAL